MIETNDHPTIPVIPIGLDDKDMALFLRLAEAMFEVIQEAPQPDMAEIGMTLDGQELPLTS